MACYTRESNFALLRSSKYSCDMRFVSLAAPYKFLPNIDSVSAARTENCEQLVAVRVETTPVFSSSKGRGLSGSLVRNQKDYSISSKGLQDERYPCSQGTKKYPKDSVQHMQSRCAKLRYTIGTNPQSSSSILLLYCPREYYIVNELPWLLLQHREVRWSNLLTQTVITKWTNACIRI